MAHIHGAKAAQAAKKVVEEAPCPFHTAAEMASESAGMKHMMGSNMGNMMSGAMGPMMEHGSGMGTMMSSRAVTASVATGAAAATAAAGHSLLRRLLTHPLVLFGAGFAAGYLIHKYREEILQSNTEIDVTE